jgi:opacity protein-like surface antigen
VTKLRKKSCNIFDETIMTSRITCLIGALTLIASATVHADEANDWSRRTSVGVHVGAAFATFRDNGPDDPPDASQYRTGFTGGGTYIVQVARVISVQAEAGFTVKGSRFDTGFPGTSSTTYMSYLELPLLVRGHVTFANDFEPYIYLGPAFGILLDAQTHFDDGRFSEANGRKSLVDIGLMMGAGMAVNLGETGAVTFDVRYNHGLRNWIDNPMLEVEAFNRAIYLTVGYRADLAMLGRLFGGSQPRGPAEPASRRRR